jgi:hypothetical protein
VRLATVTPASSEELREAVLADLDALSPGMRAVAASIPIAGRGAIDLLAADEHGGLALVSFHLEADPEAVARAVDQWEWIAANLGLLRALVPVVGLDLSRQPRLLLVAGAISGETLRLAACLAEPDIEIHEATLVSAGGARGVLLRRARAAGPIAAAAGIDPALAGLPAGEARSLMRRVIEELKGPREDGHGIAPEAIAGGVDLRREGRVFASLISTPRGVELRLFDPARSLPITDDAQCRDAARAISGASSGVTDRGGAPEIADSRAPARAALTTEEIAEFGRLGAAAPESGEGPAAPPGAPEERGTSDPPPVRILKTGFMEN